jgi:hypothetical protein
MGMSTIDVAEKPVVCCDHLAAIVHAGFMSQTPGIVKGMVFVWNWITGNRVVVLVSSLPLDGLPTGHIHQSRFFSDHHLHVSVVISPSSMKGTFL